MNREQRVLSAVIESRTAFNSVATLVSEEDFTQHVWILWEEVRDYYEEDKEAKNVDATVILDRLKLTYPRHTASFTAILDELGDVSAPNVTKEYIALKRDGIGQRLAQALIEKRDEAEIEQLIEMRESCSVLEAEEATNVLINESIDDVLTAVQPENIIAVHPKVLADCLDGGFVPGNQVAIYAPTEVGKTLVALDMTCGFLRDGRKVLYCGNEDPARSLLLRIYSNLSGMNKHQIMADPRLAWELASAEGYGNLIMLDMSPGSISEIRRNVEKYEPEIVVVDQMANMSTTSDFSKTEKNEWLATQLRSVAKKYGIVTIILHQASDNAYGRLVLEKNDMYYSNVGVQGQIDVMIGIGMDSQYEQQNQRMYCITKNKNSGVHKNIPVSIIPELSKVNE
jgi:archaellum biogenesis ATPase FlaH